MPRLEDAEEEVEEGEEEEEETGVVVVWCFAVFFCSSTSFKYGCGQGLYLHGSFGNL
jgi:hypothetical protein